MLRTKVTRIIDGDTFRVSPGWQWRGHTGNLVRPTGYDAPERDEDPVGWATAKRKLAQLILGKDVDLGNSYKVDRGRLVCDVFYNGRNLASYFPEYRLSRKR